MLEQKLVLSHLIAERASSRPDEEVLVGVEGGSFTYGALKETFLTWADVARRLGVSPGQTLLTMARNNADSYALWLGISWLGAIEVPINIMFRGRMLQYVINNSESEVMIASDMFLDQIAEVAGDLDRLKILVVIGDASKAEGMPFTVLRADDLLSEAKPAADLPGPAYHDTSCMIYTSGTTGPSKGVLVPWYELYQLATAVPAGFMERGTSHYNFLPTFHVGGKSVLYLSVLNEVRLVQREWFSVSEFFSDIKQFGCVSAGLIGSMATLIFGVPEHADEKDTPLRRVTMAPLIAELDAFKKRFGVEISTGFGMTEVGAPLGSVGFELPNNKSCGRPRPGYQVRVADELDEPVGPGVIGELLVRSDEPWMMSPGYWKMPERTAEAWRNGWFHTGDAFTYDEDGNYYFADRIKDAIRRRGENISSFEVEAYVLEHPGVLECAAIGVPSELTEDDLKVVIVRQPNQELASEELIQFLIPKMPRFMIPRYVEFVDALPKTPTMRVRKIELRENAVNENTWDREKAGIELPK